MDEKLHYCNLAIALLAVVSFSHIHYRWAGILNPIDSEARGFWIQGIQNPRILKDSDEA